MKKTKINNFDLRPGEEVNTLVDDNLYIIQGQNQFRFGIDSVLLANWAKVKRKDTVIDLGTGNGAIPLILAYKRQPKKIIGLEIQKPLVELARRSVLLNEMSDKIDILKYDLRQAKEEFHANYYPVVISNPPYFALGGGGINPEDSKAIARHEVCTTLTDLIKAAAYLLKTKGKFYFIHRVDRLPEICSKLSREGIEAKLMRLIQPHRASGPNLVLIKGVKGANPGLKMEPNLVVYDQNGEYTEEVLKMYYEE